MNRPAIGELEWWHREFTQFRRKVYILITVGFALTISGFAVIAISYETGQHDVHRVSCANSQTLITQYEWFRLLAEKNQTGLLTPEQIRQRADFYQNAERLALERAGSTCATLVEMQARAKLDIKAILGDGL